MESDSILPYMSLYQCWIHSTLANSSYEEQDKKPLPTALHSQENEEPPIHIVVLIVMVNLLETIPQSLNIQEDTNLQVFHWQLLMIKTWVWNQLEWKPNQTEWNQRKWQTEYHTPNNLTLHSPVIQLLSKKMFVVRDLIVLRVFYSIFLTYTGGARIICEFRCKHQHCCS